MVTEKQECLFGHLILYNIIYPQNDIKKISPYDGAGGDWCGVVVLDKWGQ